MCCFGPSPPTKALTANRPPSPSHHPVRFCLAGPVAAAAIVGAKRGGGRYGLANVENPFDVSRPAGNHSQLSRAGGRGHGHTVASGARSTRGTARSRDPAMPDACGLCGPVRCRSTFGGTRPSVAAAPPAGAHGWFSHLRQRPPLGPHVESPPRRGCGRVGCGHNPHHRCNASPHPRGGGRPAGPRSGRASSTTTQLLPAHVCHRFSLRT